MVINNIIRVPEKKYIQTLIVGKNNAALIVDELQMRKIPIPSIEMKAIYNEVVKSCPIPNFFHEDCKVDPPTEWLENLGISAMYAYRFNKPATDSIKGCKGAFDMLEDPKMVKYIHALCLSGVDKDDIELILNAKYNISFETPDFEKFMTYFANYDGWSYTDKEMFVNQVLDQDLKKVYRNALTKDRTTLIWELGLGTDPDASFDDMLKDMFTDTYFYFKRTAQFKPEDAVKFATLATKLSDRMDAIRDRDTEQKDLYTELKIKLENEDTTKTAKGKERTIVVDINDMDIEIPEHTETKIQNLEAMMGTEDKMRNVFDE